MSNNTPGVKTLLQHASKLFYSMPKFKQRSSVTPHMLIIYLKRFFKLIPRSILKFPKTKKY